LRFKSDFYFSKALVLRHLAHKVRDQSGAYKILPPILGPTLAAAHFWFIKCDVLKLEHGLLLLTLTSMAMLVEWAWPNGTEVVLTWGAELLSCLQRDYSGIIGT